MKFGIFLLIVFILSGSSLIGQTSYSWPIATDKDISNSWLTFDSLGGLSFDTIESWIPISSSLAVFKNEQNQFLFTNGCGIFDYKGQLIENGDKINDGPLANFVCEQTGYIVPNGISMIQFPGSKDSILMIHLKAEVDADLILKFNALLFTLITKNNQDKYIVTQKNLPILEGNFDSYQLIKHANGRDWWIYLQDQAQLSFHLYLISPSGIQLINKNQKLIGPQNIDINSHSISKINYAGNILSIYNPSFGLLVYRFDRCAGLFNYIGSIFSITNIYEISDLAYSNDDSLLYVSGGRYVDVIKMDKIGIESNPSTRHELPLGCLAYRLFALPDGNVLVGDIHSKPVYHFIHPNNDSFSILRNKYSLIRHQLHTFPTFVNDKLQALVRSPCDTIKLSTKIENIKSFPNIKVTKNLNSISISAEECFINRVQIISIEGKIIISENVYTTGVIEIKLPSTFENNSFNSLAILRLLCNNSIYSLKIII